MLMVILIAKYIFTSPRYRKIRSIIWPFLEPGLVRDLTEKAKPLNIHKARRKAWRACYTQCHSLQNSAGTRVNKQQLTIAKLYHSHLEYCLFRARSITMEQIYPGKEAWPAERC